MRKHYMFACCIITAVAFTNCAEQDKGKPAFDTSNMDLTVKPGEDFNAYASGAWIKNAKMPDDKSVYGAFNILAEENDHIVKDILQRAAAKKNAPLGSSWQKVGDFYASGMDTITIEQQGFEPIKADLEQIANIKSVQDLQERIATLHQQYVTPLFVPYAGQDQKNTEVIVMNVYSGGLGLSDRDYYLNNDSRSIEIRNDYKEHLTTMFTLIGQSPEQAAQAADQVMALETRLAKVTQTRLEQRDPYLTYNKVTLNDLQMLSPAIEWNKYFERLGISIPTELVIDNPKFFTEISKMQTEVSIDEWKNYLTWNVVSHYAKYLSSAFENENFNFYSRKLSGSQTNRPRWQRIGSSANFAIGELVGQIFVEENFPPVAKEKMVTLIGNLKLAFKERISNLSWMCDSTKAKAIDKLETMVVKVGYPDKWTDYSSLEIDRNSYAENMKRAMQFSFRDNMSKLGKPVDRTEWGMTPQTVNAYYNPLMNEIVFPAGILQPPFFNINADDAVNYGAIGVVIGHEMTHGFDDQGRNFNKNGILTDWWTKDDSENFEQRTQVLVDQYSNFVAIDSMHVDGKLTLGENIADYGGLTISYLAFQKSLEGKETPQSIDGFTANQRFFLAYANVWRQIIRDKELMRRVKEDVHSPGKFRVNGALFNIPEFYEAFEISTSDPLYIAPEKRAKIW